MRRANISFVRQREIRAQTRCTPLTLVAHCAQQAMPCVRRRPRARTAGEQPREDDGADGLHGEKEERVVARVRPCERLDVEQAIDVSDQASAYDLGNHDEDDKRDQPPLPDQTTHPLPIIRSRFAVPEAFAEVACANGDPAASIGA